MMTPRGSAAGRLLVLRPEASPSIGTGHLMRLLALGQAWLDAGGHVRVLAGDAPGPLLDRLRAEGFDVDQASDVGSPDPRLLAILTADPDARAVIDSPHIGVPDLAALAGVADRVLVMDDIATLPHYPVAWVVNQNAHADRAAYPAESGPRYLLGLRYVVLRREFARLSAARPVAARARHLLVSFGGADPGGMTLRAVHALERLPAALRSDLDVRVVVGVANPAGEALERAVSASSITIALARDVRDMASQMVWADIALSSGGTTVWELARSGCPTLVVETAPPELLLAQGLARVGLFDRLGPAATLDDGEIATAIARRIDDDRWRSEMAIMGPRLVDGQGASRVISALLAVAPSDVEDALP
jgi:UDP-2,4-diacetamido-2,4,6-trideoxy-beta-L-altropyranose hydrolase